MAQKVITQQDIANNSPFVLKWSKVPSASGVFNPGWKQQTEADKFLELIENTPTLMNDARFIPMESMQYDISYLKMDVELESMEVLTGDYTGAQSDQSNITDTTPTFSRSSLEAHGYTAKTWTQKTWLLANIEKDSFLPHIEQILAERAGYSAELISVYGKRKASSRTKAGYDHMDGILEQCSAIATDYATASLTDPQAPMGTFTDIDLSKPIIPQIKKMIAQYSKQQGNRANAKLYVSSTMEGRLMEEADARETVEGDRIYFKGDQLYIWGVPIIVANFLDTPKNSYNEHIILANPDSIVYGFLEDITSENEYSVDKKAYLSTVDVFFDVLILYAKDVLVAEVPPIE